MSVISWLHARNLREQRAIDARENGWDPATAAEIARRIRAEVEPCTAPVHPADCARCFGARYLDWAAQIAEKTGGLR